MNLKQLDSLVKLKKRKDSKIATMKERIAQAAHAKHRETCPACQAMWELRQSLRAEVEAEDLTMSLLRDLMADSHSSKE